MKPAMRPDAAPVPRASRWRWLAAVIVTALFTLGIGWLSRASFVPPDGDAAFVRLSWRFRTTAVESCRVRTEAELEALPVHMRSPEVCERHAVRYRLTVMVDGQTADTSTIVSGGIKGDRPVYVMREYRLPPGRRRVRVTLDPDADARSAGAASLALDTVLSLRVGRVHLVTLDPSARALLVRASDKP